MSRSIRILLINPNTSAVTTAAMAAVAQSVAPNDIRIEAVTAAFGSSLIQNEAQLAVATEAVGLLIAQRQPHIDAIIVSAFGDPGLEGARRTVACPVTGIAEAGMAEAAQRAGRFAIVTTTPDLVRAIDQAAERYGYAGRYLGVFLTQGDAQRLMADRAALEEKLEAACWDAVEAGADSVVIGGGPLAIAGRAIASRLAVPVIEPIPAAVRLTLRRLRETQGCTP